MMSHEGCHALFDNKVNWTGDFPQVECTLMMSWLGSASLTPSIPHPFWRLHGLFQLLGILLARIQYFMYLMLVCKHRGYKFPENRNGMGCIQILGCGNKIPRFWTGDSRAHCSQAQDSQDSRMGMARDTVPWMETAKFQGSKLRTAGYTIPKLWTVGHTVPELEMEGYTTIPGMGTLIQGGESMRQGWKQQGSARNSRRYYSQAICTVPGMGITRDTECMGYSFQDDGNNIPRFQTEDSRAHCSWAWDTEKMFLGYGTAENTSWVSLYASFFSWWSKTLFLRKKSN